MRQQVGSSVTLLHAVGLVVVAARHGLVLMLVICSSTVRETVIAFGEVISTLVLVLSHGARFCSKHVSPKVVYGGRQGYDGVSSVKGNMKGRESVLTSWRI